MLSQLFKTKCQKKHEHNRASCRVPCCAIQNRCHLSSIEKHLCKALVCTLLILYGSKPDEQHENKDHVLKAVPAPDPLLAHKKNTNWPVSNRVSTVLAQMPLQPVASPRGDCERKSALASEQERSQLAQILHRRLREESPSEPFQCCTQKNLTTPYIFSDRNPGSS